MPFPLPFLCHEAWPIKHGFFGRSGGFSPQDCEDLRKIWDEGFVQETLPQRIQKINAPTLNTLGLTSGGWLAHQQHTSRVVHLPRDAQDINRPGDALISKDPQVVLGVLTADCAPILLYESSIPIIAAIHAGWRGAVAGIIEKTLGEMYALGARFSTLYAILGPMIGPASYEVSPDFIPMVEKATPWDISSMVSFHENTYFFDLPLYVHKRLEPWVAHIYDTKIDTFQSQCAPLPFFSHRYGVLQDKIWAQEQGGSQRGKQEGLIPPLRPHNHGRNVSWISLREV